MRRGPSHLQYLGRMRTRDFNAVEGAVGERMVTGSTADQGYASRTRRSIFSQLPVVGLVDTEDAELSV